MMMALINSRDGKIILDTSEVLIIVGVTKPNGHSFRLVKGNMAYACPIRKEEVSVYFLQEGGGDDSFDAHFCPYAADSVFGIRVDNTYNYFFTAALSGCNLGFGTIAEDGSHWVGHSNAATVGGLVADFMGDEDADIAAARVVQQAIQAHMLQSLTPVGIVKPEGYGRAVNGGEDERKATVMGIRNPETGGWKYFRQNYIDSDLY
jgi:hypothetical protein